MTKIPSQGGKPLHDVPIVVAHPRLLVAESLCVALQGLGVHAHLDHRQHADIGLVEVTLVPFIERLVQRGTSVVSFGRADGSEIARAEAAGALDHLDEHIGLADLVDRLARVLRGGGTLRGARARRTRDPLEDLTPREREVLQALVSGMRAADIARNDYVSVTTVRNQIQSILTKLNAHSQIEAISIAVRAGWTPLAA